VVEAVVVVGEEVERLRQHEPVAEGDPRGEQHAREEDEERHDPLRALLERGREEAPELPEQDREGERDARHQADLERGQERLGDAEGDQLAAVGRQRPLEPADEVLVEDERHRRRDGERDQRDDDPVAELVEVLDERRLLAVAEAPRDPHRALGTARGAALRTCGLCPCVRLKRPVDTPAVPWGRPL
jgi:hypothetical protein